MSFKKKTGSDWHEAKAKDRIDQDSMEQDIRCVYVRKVRERDSLQFLL